MKELHRGVLGHRIIHISISCNIHIQIHRFQFHIIIIKYFIFFMSATCAQRLTFRFRNFSVSRLLPIFWGFRFQFRRIWSQKKSLGFGKFGLGKKSRFRFRKTVSVSVLENLVSEKSFSFGKFGLEKKGLVLVSENLVSEKKKNTITRKKLDQVNSANLLFKF